VALLVAACVGLIQSGGTTAEKRPQIVGAWTGTWGLYSPPKLGEAQPPAPKALPEMRLDCKVVEKGDGKWQATFEGEAGRPYKYTIQMEGRQAGNVVLFKGSVDLGEKDGGAYDWIGRATETEFVGFYTSPRYTGHFRLGRMAN
jgi:hypothetical protein